VGFILGSEDIGVSEQRFSEYLNSRINGSTEKIVLASVFPFNQAGLLDLSVREQEVLGRIDRLLPFDKTRAEQKTTPTVLHCRGNFVTELLPSNDRGYTPTDAPLIRHGPYRQ
jgi:hypothetical protein